MASAIDYAAGLRDLADWIEAHPDLAKEFYRVEAVAYPPDTIESVRTWVKAMAYAKKDYGSETFTLSRNFGPVRLCATVYRETVCEKIVTEREVTEMVPDPDAPLIEVTRTEETTKWNCKPILDEVPA